MQNVVEKSRVSTCTAWLVCCTYIGWMLLLSRTRKKGHLLLDVKTGY